MADGFTTVMDLLEPLRVQFVWPRKPVRSFILGDTPLVHWHGDGRLGALGGVALGDATKMFMPLSPQFGAFFTSRQFPHCPVTNEQVELLNLRSWDCAMRFVAAHPDTNIKRSTLKWAIRSSTE